MTHDRDLARALERPDLPASIERWRVVLEPGTEQPTCAAEWAGAMVLVEDGTLEVVCEAGGHEVFDHGDLLALGWLPISLLRNAGAVSVRLLAVRRDRPSPTDDTLRVVRSRRGR
jgi:hypothetical protein